MPLKSNLALELSAAQGSVSRLIAPAPPGWRVQRTLPHLGRCWAGRAGQARPAGAPRSRGSGARGRSIWCQASAPAARLQGREARCQESCSSTSSRGAGHQSWPGERSADSARKRRDSAMQDSLAQELSDMGGSWSCSNMPKDPHEHGSSALTISSGAVALLEGASSIDLVDGLAQLEQLTAWPALNAMPPACSLHSTCIAS